jgi:hypothetical protein
MDKFYISNISGGAGKNLMFSAVAKNINKAYPNHKHIVISPYPELLINNPSFYRVYRLNQTPYFYEDFIENKDVIINSHEPYNEQDFLLNKRHLIETWSNLSCGISDMVYPAIYITERERSLFLNKNSNLTKKPILVIQPFGGPNKETKFCWNRDIPSSIAAKIVEYFSKDYNVVQISRPDQIKLNCIQFSGSFREICCLLQISTKRLLIDSFCQHACAALKLPSTVLWVTNSPKVFGYDIHKNIKAGNSDTKIHYIDSFLQKENWNGEWNHYYPYKKEEDVFNFDEIIESLKD